MTIASVCVSLCEDSVSSLQHACAEASHSADLIELRLDCLDPSALAADQEALRLIIQNTGKPIILTYRPSDQGGQRNLDLETRIRFWQEHHLADFLDIEFELLRHPHLTGSLDWDRVICSQHFFGPEANTIDLNDLYQQMSQTPARVLKIAVSASDVTDCLPIFRLLERAQSEGRELIAIAMGAAGIATRVLGPSRGAFLTYTSLENDKATAPGQLTIGDLRNIYRVEQIDRDTAIFGLIGRPVSHSLSPLLQNRAFQAAGLNAVFLPFAVNDAGRFLARMVHPAIREIDWNLGGLSVTAPHKSAVMDHLDWIDPAAAEIGAVNTIVVEEGQLEGFNTDAESFVQALIKRMGDLSERRCAVIGAGGAARAAAWGLRREGCEITVFGRNIERVEAFATQYGVRSAKLDGAHFGDFEVVVNATPLGTAGALEGLSVVSSEQLRGAALAYDLVYNPEETEFLRRARDAGCQTLGGLEMFITQAEAQFRLWTKSPPPEGLMGALVRKRVK